MSRFHVARVFLLTVLAGLTMNGKSRAADLVAELDFQSTANSNVFLDKSAEWDLSLDTSAELGLDFARYWSVGYSGRLSAYTQHTELLSHWHELYLFINPAWGEDGENELTAELSVDTLRNQDDYAFLDLVKPSLLLKLQMEPESWFRWSVSASAAYRLFYKDRSSSSADAWARGQVSFTLPTRTTLSPRAACGFRFYTNTDSTDQRDSRDLQFEFGLHFSQALWKQAGLQGDYAYLLTPGESGILGQKLTQPQFSFLGEEFFFSGHAAMVGLKQLFGRSIAAGAHVRIEERAYAGWAAVDGNDFLTGEDRHDWRLTTCAFFGYAVLPRDEGRSAYIPEVNVRIVYSFLRQFSNSDWYDTSANVVGVSIWGAW